MNIARVNTARRFCPCLLTLVMLASTISWVGYSVAQELDLIFADGLEDPANGDCEMKRVDLKMLWSTCGHPDCYEGADRTDGQIYRWLRLPSEGPVVEEGHLVTTAEPFATGWPDSATDQITRHYSTSQDASGFVSNRTQPWIPASEGGSEFGQSASGTPLPVLDEAWHINMFWQQRPAKGARMIVINPVTGQAVVAAAGYDTGPAANSVIAGTVEEIHRYLATAHLDDLLVGFAANQSLPLGPVDCP